MNAVLSAFCAFAAGCGSIRDVSLVVIDARSDASEDIVQDACAVWDLTCVSTLEEVGAVMVILSDRPGLIEGSDVELGGLATVRACKPRVWSMDSHLVLAHELGHVLGLRHVADPNNVMHLSPGTETTPDQTERVHRHAYRLAACVGRESILD